MKNIFILLAILLSTLQVFANDGDLNFSKMKKLWCTVDYKHWAVNYSDNIGFTEREFYLYLDEKNKKVYNQNKEEMTRTIDFNEKDIKFENNFHADKRTYNVNYVLDRYTGRAKGKGTVRHDYKGWASITYENRDFEAKGQCALYSEERKF